MDICIELPTPAAPTSPSETSLPSPPPPRRRVRPSRYETLQAIHDSTPHLLQLQHYRDEEKSYRSLVDSQEEICRILTNRMYQLLGMFAVFQGVLVSAISQATVLTCRDVWSPVSLSLTACVATLLAVAHKLASIGDMKVRVQSSKDRANAIYGKIEEMKLKGMDFDFNREPEGSTIATGKKGLCLAFSRYGITVMAILVIFSLTIVISCGMLLCRECKCRHS